MAPSTMIFPPEVYCAKDMVKLFKWYMFLHFIIIMPYDQKKAYGCNFYIPSFNATDSLFETTCQCGFRVSVALLQNAHPSDN
jgi:hypothetical protein